MKRYVEIDETITRTYVIEVEETVADELLRNSDAYSWYNDITLADYLDYHNKGTLLEEEATIDYASLTEETNTSQKTTELYYAM